MTAASAFETWWAGFRRRPGALDDPHAAARRIGRRLRSLTAAEQPRFIEGLFAILLQEEHAYGVVLYMLEQVTDPRALATLAERLQPLPPLQSEDEEAHLADLIRILAAADQAELDGVVETYLLERATGPQWASVPWALWPHRRELFGAAWNRYFREQQPTASESTLVIRSFLSEPEAILAVRTDLADEAPEAWSALRDALLRQAGSVRWLDDAQRAALERSLR